MISLPGDAAGSKAAHGGIDAIRQRLSTYPQPAGFCLIALENMDLVEVAGSAGTALLLRERIRAEICAALGQGCVLADARDDGFLLALPPDDRLSLLGAIDQLVYRLPFCRYDQVSYSASVTARAGIVWLDESANNDPQILHRNAVAAVTAARSGQKARMVYDYSGIGAISEIERTSQLICDLPAAIEEKRLFLLAQEIVSCAPGAPRGREYEILLQMRGRNGKIYPPGMFLLAAEQSRLIEIVDSWVLRSVLVDFAPALQARPELSVSVNVAARTLSNPGFRNYLAALLNEGGISPPRVQIEITETAMIRDLHQAQTNIRAARNLGCRIALDDFGAGMSGYGYLKTFEPTCLKIDGSLIPDVADPSHPDARIVQSIVSLGHDLGIEVVAEHVSSNSIFTALKSFGVDKVQGFQFGRPAPLHSIFHPDLADLIPQHQIAH